MKIIVNGLDLNDAINKVSKALPTRDVAPTLECIKVIANEDQLTLFATDKDLAIEKTIDANVIVSGVFLVPGKLFGEYIRNIAQETEIVLETTDENKLHITSLNSECTIALQDVNNYPKKEDIVDAQVFKITEGNLKDIINKVIFSVAADDTRPILKGVNFKAQDFVLTTVATDGYRFAMCKKPLEDRVSNEINATVPARSLKELEKLLSDGEDIVNVFIERSKLMIQLDKTILIARLLTEGQYIKYDSLIPSEFITTIIADKEGFERSLNIASIMSRNERNNVVVLEIGEYTMNIKSTSELGSAKEELQIAMNGKDVRCSYNSKYINDCLRVLDTEKIKMQFAQHNSCVITINNSDEVLYFILPVRTIA